MTTTQAHIDLSAIKQRPALDVGQPRLQPSKLLADATDELTRTWREFVFRFQSHAEFVNALRDSCEPVRTAFEPLDQGSGERLYQELVALVAAHDREPGRSVAVPSEYLEAIAVVR